MKQIAVLCVGFGMLLSANSAFANLVLQDSGSYRITNSWTQTFTASLDPLDSGSFNFNVIGAVLTSSAGSFEPPVFSGFDPPDNWSAMQMNTTSYAAATGGAVSSLTFNMTFNDPPSNSLAFDFYAINVSRSVLVDSAHAAWNGSSWTITTPGWVNCPPEQILDLVAVPLPASILLGVVAVGLAGRKLRQLV